MIYCGATGLARSFPHGPQEHHQIAEEIPEDKYGFRPAGDARAHRDHASRPGAHSLRRAPHYAGRFLFFGFRGQLQAEAKAPRSKAQILELLRTEGEKFAKALEGYRKRSRASRLSTPKALWRQSAFRSATSPVAP